MTKAIRPPVFKPGELNVYSTPRDVTEVSRALRHTGRRIMLVPTMGEIGRASCRERV